MTVRYCRAGLPVAFAIASILLPAGLLEAQGTCAEAISRAGDRIEAFNAEATKQGLDFAVDTGVSKAIGGATQLLKNSASPATLRTATEMDVFRQKLEAWETVQQTFAVTIEDLWQCIAPGSGCSLQTFAARQSAAFQRWLETFLSEGTQGALDRVRKARSLLQSNVRQLGGDLQRTTSEAVACMKQVSEAARAADPVDLSTPADSHLTPPLPEPEPPTRGSGMGGAAMGLGLAAAGGAGYLAYKYAMEAVELEGDSDTGGSSGSMTYLSGSFNCRYNAGGIVSSCADSTIRVSITARIPRGTSVRLDTNRSMVSGVRVTANDPPGTVEFAGFSGPHSCPSPVTTLILVKSDRSVTYATVSGLSIPVTCR